VTPEVAYQVAAAADAVADALDGGLPDADDPRRRCVRQLGQDRAVGGEKQNGLRLITRAAELVDAAATLSEALTAISTTLRGGQTAASLHLRLGPWAAELADLGASAREDADREGVG
jgi:hypothetical protein